MKPTGCNRIDLGVFDDFWKFSLPEIIVVCAIAQRFPYPVAENSHIANGRKNVLQALWNLRRGDTKKPRDLLTNLRDAYPLSFSALKAGAPAACLPIHEGRVLDILRRNFSFDKIKERQCDVLAENDNRVMGCVVFLLHACDLDLAERGILPQNIFKLLLERRLAGGGGIGYAKTWLDRQLELAHKDGIKKKHILEKMPRTWDERKLRRKLDCHLAKGKLPAAEDYCQIFRAVMALRLEKNGVPTDYLDTIEQILFGIFSVAAAIDWFHEHKLMNTTDSLKWYETADKWFAGKLL